MKVCHIVSTFKIGGAEKLVYNYFENRKCFSNDDLSFVALTSNKNKFVKNDDDITFLSSKSEYNPFLIFSILSLVRNNDIIHIHLFPTLYWVVFAKLLTFSKVKLVYTEHSSQTNRTKYKIFKYLDRFVYGQISKVVAVSNGVRDSIVERQIISDHKIDVVLNGVPLPVEITRNLKENNNFRLLQISRFTYQKDHETLIKSLLYLPENVILDLIGDGENMGNMVNLVTELNLSHRVVFHGELIEFNEIIVRSDIIVLSSNFEGLALSVIEGMAFRKPVVGSNIPGLDEIIMGYGYLFKPKDEHDLAKHIISLISNIDEYQNISEKCYERAQHFSIEKNISNLNKLYAEIK